MDKRIYTTKNANETRTLGKNLAKTLNGGEVICLYGQLGNGKTTFTQGLASGMGINKRIISPTFILMREYDLPDNKRFYHLDCYRLEKAADSKNLGLEDLFKDKNNIIVIEWAERVKDLLPKERIDVVFENKGEDKRIITIISDY